MHEILHQLISSLSVYPIVFRSVFKSQVVHDSSINSITISSLPAYQRWNLNITHDMRKTHQSQTPLYRNSQNSSSNIMSKQAFTGFFTIFQHTQTHSWCHLKNRLSKTAKPFQKSPSDRSPMGCSSNVERRPSTTSIHVQPFNTRITK